MKPYVTIVVTAKNSEKTIGKCIQSLLAQDFKKPYLIYLSDAYSTDSTWVIMKGYREKYPSKIIIERIKGNAPHAFNCMIKKVKSRYIAFTDSDCVVERNWLNELLKPYNMHKRIIATAGFCGTPKDVNLLQKIIGKELENRFKKAGRFLLHAPTMNFSIIASIAKKCKMNEDLDVAFETEWGMRLNKKFGKIFYTPKAKVYHFHRSTFLDYLRQQFKQATYVPAVYFTHKEEFLKAVLVSQKDPISSPLMSMQIELFSLFLLFLLASVIVGSFKLLIVALATFVLLCGIEFYQSIKFSQNLIEFFVSLLIFTIRVPVWTFGIIYGLLRLFVRIKENK